MSEIHWSFYPRVIAVSRARAWIEINEKLLRAPKTIDAYARGLEDFLSVCDRLGIEYETATTADIASYVDEMAHRPRKRSPRSNNVNRAGALANKTMQQRLTAIRLFYDFLVEQRVRDSNPVGRGRYTPGTGFYGTRERGLLRRFEKPPWIPSEEQWNIFLEIVLREEPLRNQLMVFMSYDGALRRGELLSLTLSDIDFSHRKITIRPEIAKNGSGRIVFYGDATSDLLCRYVQYRQRLLGAHSGPRLAPLFLSESHRNHGHPLTFEMWNKIVQSLAKRSALPLFRTHTFRHLRLTDLARCKLELYEIAMYAGHRNFKTTHQYIQLSSAELGEHLRLVTRHLDERNNRLLQKMWSQDGNN